MKQSHKHAELIKAWADGAEIECWDGERWFTASSPCWSKTFKYRIKPEPKPDVVQIWLATANDFPVKPSDKYNLKLTFDGETGKLKSAEVL